MRVPQSGEFPKSLLHNSLQARLLRLMRLIDVELVIDYRVLDFAEKLGRGV